MAWHGMAYDTMHGMVYDTVPGRFCRIRTSLTQTLTLIGWQILLDKGKLDLNAVSFDGYTALGTAAIAGVL